MNEIQMPTSSIKMDSKAIQQKAKGVLCILKKRIAIWLCSKESYFLLQMGIETDAPIAHRIMWLDGLEPGFNRGGSCDSHSRYIYIHGLNDEPSLGAPASIGCVHMAAKDLIPLFDELSEGTLVWIRE